MIERMLHSVSRRLRGLGKPSASEAEFRQCRLERDGYKSAYEAMATEAAYARAELEAFKAAASTGFDGTGSAPASLRLDGAHTDLLQARAELDGYKRAYEAVCTELAGVRFDLDRLRPHDADQVAEGPASAAEAPAPARDDRSDCPRNDDPPNFYTPIFAYDGLRTDPAIIHNHDFMKDPRFRRAMQRALQAHGHSDQYWRLHVALWAAAHAVQLPGDFVECGVWKGFLGSGIMSYLDWNRLDRKFFLFDTFCGLDESQVSPEEVAKGNLPHFRKHYVDNYDEVVRNFSEFRNVVIVRGSVPATLRSVDIDAVAYLSIDMNNANPEIQAAEHFWDRLVPGGVILLDDYGFVSYEEQKRAFDAFAQRHGVPLLALPTGQGLILKP